MSADKLDRLPRWARDEITNSRRKIATLEEALRLGVVGENFPKANLHLTQNQLDWMPLPHPPQDDPDPPYTMKALGTTKVQG